MRILIIGGTRFIGPHVVRLLHGQGHHITLFHRGQTQAELPADIRHIHGDRAHLIAFRDEMRRLAPEVVLDMFPFNAQDARPIMETFSTIARRVVALSSQDVYRAYGRLIRTEPGEPDPVPLTEDSPLREKHFPYRGETPRSDDDPHKSMDSYEKIEAEQVFMSEPDLPGTILRLPMVYGPGDNQHRLFKFLKRMDDGRQVILVEDQVVSWHWTRGYVEDIAHGIALAVTDEQAAGRIYNLGEAVPLAYLDWIQSIAAAVGWQGQTVPVPVELLPEHLKLGGDARQDWLVDTTRARNELGYRETCTREEGLQRTIAWERANPPAHIDLEQFDYAAEDAILAALPAPS